MPLFGGMINTDRLNRALTSLSDFGGKRTSASSNGGEEWSRSPSNKDITTTLSSVAGLVAYSIKDEGKRVKENPSNCAASSSSSSAFKENTITNTPLKNGDDGASRSRGNSSKKSFSTPLSQRRTSATSSEKKRMSRHLQDRILSSTSPLDVPYRAPVRCIEEDELSARQIAARCLEEDELDAKLRASNSDDIIAALKQEVFSTREELRSSRADAALNKKALLATKSKLDVTTEELMKATKELRLLKIERDEVKSRLSSLMMGEEAASTKEQLKLALDEIQKLKARLCDTKPELDDALLEVEELRDDKYNTLRTVNSTQDYQNRNMPSLQTITRLSAGDGAINVCHTPSKRSVVSSPLLPSSLRTRRSSTSKFLFPGKPDVDGYVPSSRMKGPSFATFEHSLLQFYQLHNPNKLHEVKNLLSKYEGRA